MQWRGARPALARWEAIASVLPDNAPARFNWAVSLEQAGDWGRAAAEYRHTLRLNARYEKAHYNLAGLLARSGDAAGAVVHYEAALRLRPQWASAHNNLGVLYLGQRDFVKAITAFEGALASEPGNPGFAANLALAHAAQARELEAAGRAGEAVRHYRDALRLWPGDVALARDFEDLRRRSSRGGVP
jgi:tetratricopeptide (TPR) repeat protein